MTTNYTYDHANRLATVNGQTYVYDNNGNLTYDGTTTYTYDSANRLKTVTGPSSTVSYAYNGLGDRLQETVNGVTTTFTMDLNTGLTQALSDGTNNYIYGVGRIAQVNATTLITDYFLTDALGSVRQLADASGAITYSRAYDPYGVVTSTTGSASTMYGFTGEAYEESTQLTYLRSRFYASGTGRFLSRDTWGGNSKAPMSYNKWNYVGSNPINRTDHTGRCWYPNQQTGGTSIDPTDSSPLMCAWFSDMLKNNGINIPPDATPQNWLNSIPPEHQAIIKAFTTCPFQNNSTFIGAGGDLWQVIMFYTKPKWHYYQSTNTEWASIDLTFFGEGGEVSWSCDNDYSSENKHPVCTGALGYGVGVNILKFKLKVGGEFNIDTTGTVHIGAKVDAGLCNLFASLTKISITCATQWEFKPKETIEFGWQTDFPDRFLVFANASNFSSISYEDFAKRRLPFHDKNEKIYYQIKGTGGRIDLYNKFSDAFLENGVYVFP